ncbi:MAG: hypothetical protein ACLFOY_12120 [Desulfatibacillaceae bacterium]
MQSTISAMFRLPGIVAVCLCLFAVFCQPAATQARDATLSSTVVGYQSAGIEDGPSEVSMLVATASLKVSYFTLSYGVNEFRWEDVSRIPFGDGVHEPWDRMHNLSLSANYRGRFGGAFHYFTGAYVGTAFEEATGDGAYGGVRGGIGYSLSGWRFSLGAMVYHDGFSWGAWPVAGVAFGKGTGRGAAAGEGDREDVSGFSASIGFPSTQVSYRINQFAGVRLSGNWWRPTYALADDSTVLPDGFVRFRNVNAGLYADLYPASGLSVTIGGHWVFYREFSFHNDDGDLFAEFDVDAGPAASLNVSWSF